jgi:hypothetical protein
LNTLAFAPETPNIAETTRMIEIAKESKDKFRCVFFGCCDVYSHLKNVLVYDWLPAPKVNPLADIAVIHGGQGTVQTACAAGTPSIGIGLQPCTTPAGEARRYADWVCSTRSLW